MSLRPIATLTDVQTSIIQLLANGHSRKETAAALNLSCKTVDYHLNASENPNSIQAILGFSDPARLAHYAIRRGLVELQTLNDQLPLTHHAARSTHPS